MSISHQHYGISEWNITVIVITKILNNDDNCCKPGVNKNINGVQVRKQDIVRGRLESKVFFVYEIDWLIDWLIGASLSSYHEKATVRYVLDESAPA